MKAEPAESVSANTTATLLFNICILCILVQGHKSMLPTKEKPEFVFTSSTLAEPQGELTFVQQQWGNPGSSWLILLGRTGSSQRWEVWLAWGWASPTFPKVWKVQVMQGTVWGSSSWCESLHTQVLVSQGWEFLRFDGLKSVEKSMIIRGPLKVRGLLISLLPFSFFYHMRALFLTTCSKTQALLQLWPDHHEQVRSDIQD